MAERPRHIESGRSQSGSLPRYPCSVLCPESVLSSGDKAGSGRLLRSSGTVVCLRLGRRFEVGRYGWCDVSAGGVMEFRCTGVSGSVGGRRLGLGLGAMEIRRALFRARRCFSIIAHCTPLYLPCCLVGLPGRFLPAAAASPSIVERDLWVTKVCRWRLAQRTWDSMVVRWVLSK